MGKKPFFGGAPNMGNLMKEAQKMQAKMTKMQDELDNMLFTGSSGGEMVTVILNGKGILQKIDLSPEAVDPDDVDMLQDLIVAAFNDANNKVEEYSKNQMSQMTGGMSIPGLF